MLFNEFFFIININSNVEAKEMCVNEKSNCGRKQITDSGDFYFLRDTFNELFSDNGGAIYCSKKSGASVYINLCKFLKCTAAQQGGSIYFNDSNIIQIERSIFEECNSSNSQGGCMYLKSFQAPTLSTNKNYISGCSLTKCNSTGSSGGGIFIWSPPAEFKMQNTIFISCHAGGWGGGGLYFCISNSLNLTHKQFYFCYFDNNTGGTGKEVFLDDYEFQKLTSSPLSDYCFTSSNSTQRLFHHLKEGGGNKAYWLKTGTLSRNVKSNGINKGEGEECGIKEDSDYCKTVKYSVDLIRNSGKWWINVLDDVEESYAISISYNFYVKIMGKGEKVSSIKSLFSPAFSVYGNLEISSLTLTSKEHSLFSVSSTGDVEISNLLIKGLNQLLLLIY